MKCPKCDAENPDVAKFCSSCGASMTPPVPEVVVPPPVTECPACKTPRPEGAKFCSACGHAYEEVVAASAVPATLLSEPGAPGNPLPEAPKAEAPPAASSAAQPVHGSNTTVIVVVAVLLALIAAGGGWYFFKDKSASSGPVASASAVASQSAQSAAPQVDANGMPVKPSGTDGAQTGQAPQTGMPQVDANGMPITSSGSAASAPAVPNSGQTPVAGSQQQAAQPTETVMPDPMPQEARKRRAKSEADMQPKRRVRAGGSIDQQLEIRGAAECPAGGSGFWCREKIRYQLCNGHWSHNPPPGQSMCQRAN